MLKEMGMVDAFNAVVNVPVMTTAEHIMSVLEVCLHCTQGRVREELVEARPRPSRQLARQRIVGACVARVTGGFVGVHMGVGGACTGGEENLLLWAHGCEWWPCDR